MAERHEKNVCHIYELASQKSYIILTETHKDSSPQNRILCIANILSVCLTDTTIGVYL